MDVVAEVLDRVRFGGTLLFHFELGRRVGLGCSAFSARFTKLVGQSMHRYLIARRISEAAFLLESLSTGKK